MSLRIAVHIENSVEGGPSNEVINTFDFEYLAAKDTAHLVRMYDALAYGAMSGSPVITKMVLHTPGVSGNGIEIDFPEADYREIVAQEGAAGSAVEVGWPHQIHTQPGSQPTPIGTAAVMGRVATAAVGRKGRGRFYLPYLKTAAIDGSGYLKPSYVSWLTSIHGWWLLPQYTPTPPSDTPEGGASTKGRVTTYTYYAMTTIPKAPATGAPESHPVRIVKTSSVPSALRTRRR